MSRPAPPLLGEELRRQVSEILVKWDMPTRQAAINEIMAAFGRRQEAAVLQALESLDKDMQRYIDTPIKQNTPFTSALEQARLGRIQMQRLVKERLAAHPNQQTTEDKS